MKSKLLISLILAGIIVIAIFWPKALPLTAIPFLPMVGQVTSNTARRLRKGATLPAVAAPGDVFIKTSGGSTGEYVCLVANTWVGPFASGTIPVKASGAEVDTGTDDAKFVTALALANSDYIKEADLPAAGITNSATSGQVPISDGTNLTGDADLTFATETLTATKIAGALNGTVGATTPAAGAFTTLSATSPADASVPLSVKGTASQSADLMQAFDKDGSTVRTSLNPFGLIGTRGIWMGAGFNSTTAFYDTFNFGVNTAGQNSWSFTGTTAFRAGSVFTFGWASDPNGIGTAADSNLSRVSAGLIGVGTGAQGSKAGRLAYTVGILEPLTVATLPTPATGMYARVTDGDAGLAWGATVVNTGAGATNYLVWYNGSAWTVAGK